MRSTLFYIHAEIEGWPLFGFGLLLAAWGVACAVILLILVRRQGWSSDTLGYLPVMGLVAAVVALVMPRLVEEGRGLPIRGYGVMLLAGAVSGLALAARRARARGIDAEHIFSMSLGVFACGIVGARLFYVIEYWEQFQRETVGQTLAAMANIAQGGLVVYGSFLGAIPAAWIYARKQRLPLLKVADIVAPSLMLGLALGRVGCFLNGCCFGGACDARWGVHFPPESPPFQRQVDQNQLFVQGIKLKGDDRGRVFVAEVEPNSPAERDGLKAGDRLMAIQGQFLAQEPPSQNLSYARSLLIESLKSNPFMMIVEGQATPKSWVTEPSSARSLSVHPSQLYSAVGAFLICLFLLAYDCQTNRDGELFALMLTIYPVVRFLEEVIRIDESSVFGTGLSISQNISLALLAACGILWAYLLRQSRRPTMA